MVRYGDYTLHDVGGEEEKEMETSEAYKNLGYTELSDVKVQDRHGAIYYPRKVTKPLRAIKHFCGECRGMDRRKKAQVENVKLVRDCVDPMCPLFDFRRGKNPFLSGLMSEEQKEAAVKRLALAHGADLDRAAQHENQREGVNR